MECWIRLCSCHAAWAAGAEDWRLTGYAINDDRVLVTNNTADFITLVGREELHPGLVCLNIAPELMNLETQKRLFQHALNHLLNQDPVNEVLEITLDAHGRSQNQALSVAKLTCRVIA